MLKGNLEQKDLQPSMPDIHCRAKVVGSTNYVEQQMHSLWVYCPVCGRKTRTKVYEDTVLIRFPLYCPKCKKEIRINIVQLKMMKNQEPTD